MPTQEKQIVLKAIDSLGRRVTAADVATKTGLPILVVNSELNKIASETEGHLEVGTAGDVAYKFSPAFQSIYAAKGVKKFFQDAGALIFKVGFFLLRISFGIMLILSLLAVIVIIIAIALAGKGDRDGDRDGGFGLDFDFFDYMILRDLLWWGSYSTYPSTYDYSYYNRPSTKDPTNSNFLFNCFSFLFGDGNPNQHLEERKWQQIAQVIKRNNGVVTSEQLAPYTGADPTNEDAVLPVLVRYDGRPEVTERGNIVYLFPSMQVSAAQAALEVPPPHLEEFKWSFTNVPADSLIPVYIIAGLNFFGSWWLLGQTHINPIAFQFAGLIHLLVIYGTLFLAIPAVRFCVNHWLNGRIEARNDRRLLFGEQVHTPTSDLKTKLIEARDYKIGEKKLTTDQIIYTSERDSLEQEFDARPPSNPT